MKAPCPRRLTYRPTGPQPNRGASLAARWSPGRRLARRNLRRCRRPRAACRAADEGGGAAIDRSPRHDPGGASTFEASWREALAQITSKPLGLRLLKQISARAPIFFALGRQNQDLPCRTPDRPGRQQGCCGEGERCQGRCRVREWCLMELERLGDPDPGPASTLYRTRA